MYDAELHRTMSLMADTATDAEFPQYQYFCVNRMNPVTEEVEEYELVKGGAEIPVTRANCHEYIALCVGFVYVVALCLSH
ncbi:hypothetical protein FACS189472_15680 [Alphaproteobacteria bacterium]|nr:hypothetical protein FACS189472_15680 [Alphaproteobacteria bacterium]